MRNFIAVKIADGWQDGVTFEAHDFDDAELVCSEQGWKLDGELQGVADAVHSDDVADDYINRLNCPS